MVICVWCSRRIIPALMWLKFTMQPCGTLDNIENEGKTD
jgi:hypothetical protein